MNPALTVIANALRVGDHLLGRELKVVPVTLMSGCSAPGKPNLVVSRIEIVRA